MEITITDKNAYTNHLRKTKIELKLSSRKRLRKLYFMMGIGIIVTVSGFLFVPSTSSMTYVNNVTNQRETYYEKTSFNLIGSLGVAWGIMVLLIFFGRKKLEEKYIDEAAKYGKVQYRHKNESTVKINTESVIIENPLSMTIIKWPVFINYFEYENFLLLSLNKTGTSSIFIDKELVSSETYQGILSLVGEKLPKRKV